MKLVVGKVSLEINGTVKKSNEKNKGKDVHAAAVHALIEKKEV